MSGMLAYEVMLELTPVTLADTPLIERWLADRDSRRFLHATGVAWLPDEEAVPDWEAGRATYLAQRQGTPVGVIDVSPAMGVCYLNFMVAPEARGQGVARTMVMQVQQVHADEHFCALVAPDNHASRHCLLRAGFVRAPECDCDELWGFSWCLPGH